MDEAIEVRLPEIQIPVREVIRRMGYPADREPEAGVQAILARQMEQASGLFRFRGICRILDVDSRDGDSLSLGQSAFRIHSRQVCRMLRRSLKAAFFMVTIGPALEDQIQDLLRRDEATEAFVLDAIGSETADEAANVLHRNILSDLARGQGMKVTPRFSPGYGDWPVTVQPDMLRICEGHRIGISVTESCLMIPRKSVSAVAGLESERNSKFKNQNSK